MRASELPTVRRVTETAASAAASGRPTARLPADEAPVVLDRYRLRRRLGSGAFGTVWAARDERLERDVAVKILPRERIIGGRFEREARAAARLGHPAIVTLYEAAVDDEGAYLVSELVNGATLAAALSQGALSDHRIAQVGIVLCDALAHAHAEGVIHRDVKPHNVLIPKRPSGEADIAKLTDFGVAQVVGGDSLTRTGDVIGTAAYMAPEQAEGRAVGPEADLYALALVLYESLTGINPFDGGTATIRARRAGTYLPPLRRQRRDLPRELGYGLDLALRPRARERGSLLDLREALGVALPQLGDRTGVVAAPWRPRRSLEATAPAPPRTRPRPTARASRRESPPQVEVLAPAAAPSRAWRRAAAAVAAGALPAWLAARGWLPTAIPPAIPVLLAAGLVLVLPRLGWLLATGGLAGLATVSGHPGVAIVLAAAMLAPALLAPRRGLDWPLALAALGAALAGIGGAWPALAGRLGPSPWRRAVLGAVGLEWIAAASALAGIGPYLRPPTGLAPGAAGSLRTALDVVLPALARPGIVATALAWAAGAALLPAARRLGGGARWTAVTVWSAGVLAASLLALRLGGPIRAPGALPLVFGALAAAVVGAAPDLGRRGRRRAQAGSQARLP